MPEAISPTVAVPVADQAQNAEFEKDEGVIEAVQNLLSRLYAVLYDKHNKNFDAAASHIEQKTNTKREQVHSLPLVFCIPACSGCTSQSGSSSSTWSSARWPNSFAISSVSPIPPMPRSR